MQKRIVRAVCAFLSVLFFCSFSALFANCLEAPSTERVGAAFVYSIENEKVMLEYNADELHLPSASVKIMTSVLVYEKLKDKLDERITVTKEMIAEAKGNHIAIEEGEILSIRDLFYAMLLKGANDATYVLVHKSYGSTENFVLAMNEKAKALGMNSTTYTNPTGMHDSAMLTTARDQAKIARLFLSYEELLSMSSEPKHVIEKTQDTAERNIYTRNAFISKLNSMGTNEYYYPDASGISYGSTEEGGDSFVTLCSRNGLSYICVILGGETGEDEHIYAFDAARALCDYVLDGFGYVKVLGKDKLVYDIPVELSEKADKVMLVPSEEIKAFLPTDVDLEKDISYSYTLTDESLVAPVFAGTPAGHISVYYRDELLGTVPLVTQNEVEKSSFLGLLESIKGFTQSKFFICTVIALAVVSLGFVLINSCRRAKRQRRNTRPRAYTNKRR